MKTERIHMYTRVGCEDSDQARQFLREHNVPFEEIDIDRSREAVRFVMSVNEGKQRTPTFEVGGRTFHCSNFDPEKLTRKLGLSFSAQSGHH